MLVRGVDQSRESERLRRLFALLIGFCGAALVAESFVQGRIPGLFQLFLLGLAFAFYTNRTGRFLRDWMPILLAMLAYVAVDQAVQRFGFTVHFTPQIEAERLLAFGSIPTNWLQTHLYPGTTGPLEVFTTMVYLSHFFAPAPPRLLHLGILGAAWIRRPALWNPRRHRARGNHLRARPDRAAMARRTGWPDPACPASHQGRTVRPPSWTAIADIWHDADSYNTVAAIPSLHVAWPLIALLVVWKFRLPRWILTLQLALVVGVLFSIVYAGEHYFVDALVGAPYVLVAWWLVQLALGRTHLTARIPEREVPGRAGVLSISESGSIGRD